MKALGDRAMAHLRRVTDEPDTTGTKYKVLSLLGRGGMGSVYVAEDTELGRSVALKVTIAGAPGAGELAVRLRREAQVIAKLEHPGIVPVHDVGTLADGRVYYAMKLVRGRRLDEWLVEDKPRSSALRLFQRVCHAVAFAHDHGVVHRDLKLENIMVGEYGEALVMDWGLAKELGAPVRVAEQGLESAAEVEGQDDTIPAAAPTRAGAVMGTPGFMAPEQARGAIEEIDARSDVFALGAILYTMLAGREPFRGGSAREVLDKVIGEPPPPLMRVPRPLSSICFKALAKDRAARYPTAAAMAEDIGAFLDALPVSAHRESIYERAARLASRYQVLLVLLAAYLLMRVTLLAFSRP